MMFVTVSQATQHLRRDTTVDDNDVILKIEAASEAILQFLSHGRDLPFEQAVDSAGAPLFDSNGDAIAALDSNGEPIVKMTVKQATLLLLGEFYLNREADQQGEIAGVFGMLPRPVVALLYPSHTPVFA